MSLNAQEFKRRSEEFFAATYLNSVGIIQNVALGVLATKLYMGQLSLQILVQIIASFLAIVIIAHEYSWWILLIRRTPSVLDYIIPYALGAAEFGVMANADDAKGIWFAMTGILSLVGMISFCNNLRYAKPSLFVECRWLFPLVRRNLLLGVAFVLLIALLMFEVWFLYESASDTWKIVFFCELLLLELGMLFTTAIFMREVRERFGVE